MALADSHVAHTTDVGVNCVKVPGVEHRQSPRVVRVELEGHTPGWHIFETRFHAASAAHTHCFVSASYPAFREEQGVHDAAIVAMS